MIKDVKKDTSEMTVEEKLSALYKLQTLMSEIDSIKNLRGELPLEVQDIEDEIERLQTRNQRLQDEIMAINHDVAAFKATIDKSKNLIARYKEQIDQVRNNREYDTLSKELEYQSLEIELAEKKIGQANGKIEEVKEDMRVNSDQIAELEENLGHKKSELDSIVAETKTQEDKLRNEVLDVEENIEPRLLNAFKRIRKNSRNGLGVVYVQRDACGGCFNKIPPQRQIDIRMRKKVIVCEYCGRILVDPELAGIETPKVEEEAPKRKTRKAAAPKKTTAKKAKEADEKPEFEA